MGQTQPGPCDALAQQTSTRVKRRSMLICAHTAKIITSKRTNKQQQLRLHQPCIWDAIPAAEEKSALDGDDAPVHLAASGLQPALASNLHAASPLPRFGTGSGNLLTALR